MIQKVLGRGAYAVDRIQQLVCACDRRSRRGAQADALGAKQVLGRGVQTVSRGAARCKVSGVLCQLLATCSCTCGTEEATRTETRHYLS
jgi:hypothetical protein